MKWLQLFKSLSFWSAVATIAATVIAALSLFTPTTASIRGEWRFVDEASRQPRLCGPLLGMVGIRVEESTVTIRYCGLFSGGKICENPESGSVAIRRIQQDGEALVVVTEDDGKFLSFAPRGTDQMIVSPGGDFKCIAQRQAR